MWDYTNQINAYFGHQILKPWGLHSRSENVVDEEEIILSVYSVITLREEGKREKKKGLVAALGRIISDYLYRPTFEEKIILAVERKDQHRALCAEKYREFFAGMESYDWNSTNMNYQSAKEFMNQHRDNGFMHLMISVAAEDELFAKVRRTELDYEKKVIRSEDY